MRAGWAHRDKSVGVLDRWVLSSSEFLKMLLLERTITFSTLYTRTLTAPTVFGPLAPSSYSTTCILPATAPSIPHGLIIPTSFTMGR